MVTWDDLECVLLDLDGTLLDKNFDNYFWMKAVPREYAAKNGLSSDEAQDQLFSLYKSQEKTLNWTDIDFWSRTLGLDIVELKNRFSHRVAVLPGVTEFLDYVLSLNKSLHLATNAHPKTIAIKMARTGLDRYFHSMISSSDIGYPKEDPRFWDGIKKQVGFSTSRTMFVDDDLEVLRTARAWGLDHVFHKARNNFDGPDEVTEEFPAVICFSQLMT
ncbi:MAG: HAD-IA family hydrolase [Deltaproteobacteria bacterium]|nr:HAD-IA family hydrolase [Deltaproteobacteria bacterium]